MSFQAEKAVIRALYEDLRTAVSGEYQSVLSRHYAPDITWRAFHPFNEISSSSDIAHTFWEPFCHSLSHLQRREDVFFAGTNDCTEKTEAGASTWVVSMGHFMGLFDHAWLGIPPTGKIAFLRYAEFNKVENGKITDVAFYFDIPHFMVQAGLQPFPPQSAAHCIQPGPQTHDGVYVADQEPAEAPKTMAAINAMVADLGQWNLGIPIEEELRRTWHEDMVWWGPEGIGATYTIPRYAEQHAGIFRASFDKRSKTKHIARVAEGYYGGFFGWPNFTAEPLGGFMGMPATGKSGEFRVIDIYRRADDKLAENWIFIDLLHFWKQQGVDILERTLRHS